MEPDDPCRTTPPRPPRVVEDAGPGRPATDDPGAVHDGVEVNESDPERHEAEAALRRSERLFRQVAETVPDILFRTGADGRTDFVNGRFEAVTGRPLDTVLGSLMWPDLVHEGDRDRVEAVWDGARATEEPYETRYRLLTTGGPRWVITRAHPVRDDGAVAAWFGTITDVDDLVRAESEVRRLNATLEDRVVERTTEVRRLSARLAAAEQAERARVARVLHDDLQQQLVGLGLTLGLLRGAADEAERDALRDQADEVLAGAVDLTRTLAADVAPPALADADLAEALRWLADRARARLWLDIAVEARPCPVSDDGARAVLYHAVRELLLNVAKHAGTGRATVRVWRDGPDAVVEVEDGGVGFDPGAASPSGGGLGLVGVRERVGWAGGRVDLDAAPGRGTRVRLAVPAGGSAGG